MTKSELRDLFDELCETHGIEGWRLVFNPSLVSTLGRCWHQRKEIHLSERMVAELPERAPLTLRHELAHALAGSGAGHGVVWKRACRVVGAIPARLADVPKEFIMAGYNYRPVCPECGVLAAGWVGKPNPGKIHTVCGRPVDIVRSSEVARYVAPAAPAVRVAVDQDAVDDRVARALARRKKMS